MEAYWFWSPMLDWTQQDILQARKWTCFVWDDDYGCDPAPQKPNVSVASDLREHRLLLTSNPVLIFHLSSALEGVSSQCSCVHWYNQTHALPFNSACSLQAAVKVWSWEFQMHRALKEENQLYFSPAGWEGAHPCCAWGLLDSVCFTESQND